MTNKQIARTLRLTANLVELTGGNPFRARAYGAASRAVDALDRPVREFESLAGVGGIGDRIADDVASLLDHGSFELLDELVASVPPGLMDVMQVRGLGPRKVRTLWEDLGVTDLEELEAAGVQGRIEALPGFGKKSVERILVEIERLRSYAGRYRYATAVLAAEPVLEALQNDAWIERAAFAGAIRRGLEIVTEVEIVVAGDAAAVRGILNKTTAPAGEVDGDGIARLLPGDIPLTVHLADEERFAIELWERTGAAEHIQAIRNLGPLADHPTSEEDIYAAVHLDTIPPELREDDSAVEAAREKRLPRLIEVSDLRGVIHNHTTASDGTNTLAEMADAARLRGFEYLGICDHSRSLTVANGLSIERLLEQQEEIRNLNKRLADEGIDDFTVLHGSEVDILGDGSLDFPDEILEHLDLVVASVHSRFEMTEEQATDRVIRAVENPFTDILGHPTGRLILRREGYPLDHDAVIEACARNQVAIELNANPHRLDIDWRHIRRAVEAGVMISINPDAHSTEELDYHRWGVAVARKGRLTKEHCLNALPLDEFRNWIRSRRTAALTVPSAR